MSAEGAVDERCFWPYMLQAAVLKRPWWHTSSVIIHMLLICSSQLPLLTNVTVKKCVPFLGVRSNSSWAVSEDWRSVAAAADEETEPFGGLYDWLPKFCLFSFALASSLSKAAVSHCSTVDTNSLQNWQREGIRHQDDTRVETSIEMCQWIQSSTEATKLF